MGLRNRLLVLAAAAACSATAGQATSARFWQASTQADLMRGEVDGLSVDDTGRLVLGPVFKTVYEATVPFIWTLAALPDGTVFAGSGNGGQVWKVDAGGRVSEFFKAKELEVHAIAVAPDGALLVGTSPDGKVYRVDAAGRSAVYFDPDDKYIWSMAIDGQGRLYVGTGDGGVIYRVAAPGKGDVFYRTQTKNVTSMAFDRGGQLLAATDSPGRVLRIDPSGKAFALLDSPFHELRALHVAADGTIFAAAINGKSARQPESSGSAPAPEPTKPSAGGSVSAEVVSFSLGDTQAATSQPGPPVSRVPDKSGAKGAVYRIDADGGNRIIWESKEDTPHDISIEDGGAVTIATGNGGKLIRVASPPPRVTLVARLGGKQITAMLTSGRTRVYATSNPAKIYALTDARAPEGTYVSDVKDAALTATWGTLTWRAVTSNEARVRVFTRSGNTSVPDDTWSTWSGPYARSDGDDIQSPAARYLQWKAVLSAPPGDRQGPSLVSLKIGYRQQNAPPHVTSITVLPAGMVHQRPYPTGDAEIAGLSDAPADQRLPVYSLPLGSVPAASPESGPSLGRKLYQKGLQAFTWRAEDDNDDRLSYDVFYRRVDSVEWKPLRRATAEQILTWDTTSVPDGTYVVSVVASDQPGNPQGQALTGSLESEGFDIDNTPPAIAVTAVTRDGASTTVTLEVADTLSSIDRMEYSIDAGPWQTLAAAGGIGDRREVRYALKLDAGALGRVVVRATDAMNNMATLKVEPPVQPRR